MGYKGDSRMDPGFMSDGKGDPAEEEALARACRRFKERLTVRPLDEPCFVVVAAVSECPHSNSLQKLTHHRSVPIGGYFCYNVVDQSYTIECMDFVHLGYVPKSFDLGVEGFSQWRCRVPAPEAVLNKLFTPDQQRDLQSFKALHRDDPVRYEFYQFLDIMSVEKS